MHVSFLIFEMTFQTSHIKLYVNKKNITLITKCRVWSVKANFLYLNYTILKYSDI